MLIRITTACACRSGLLYRARALVDTVCKEKRVSLVIRDVSWLWRSAYNCAVKGCTEWDNAEEKVPPLFDVSREVRLVLHPGLRCTARGRGPSYWKFTWKRRSRWMRRCICASCCPLLPLPRLGVCSNPTSPNCSTHLMPIGSVCRAQTRTSDGQFR
jgi:hypothetical protein